uniref:MFS transporter n=1 Tax=Thermosporothrix sp. COM3 TaxID=2490863 RepID=A0A455SEI6_9CHLR|nr:MFS transporter [Thermosporothrix sp. COM3]
MFQRKLSQKVSVSVVFVAAMFMSIMDGTIVNTALPAIGHQFSMPGTTVDAIVVSYLVSLAVIIPASGWLGDRFGTRRVFLCALGMFTVASALCGLANNFGLLVAFRVLQGIAGGAMTPVGNAMLIRTFPPAERVQVSRILNIPTVLAPATGPVLGGFLVNQFSWHWVFYVNIPIGIAALVFALLFLRGFDERTAERFDIPGFFLAGIGLALGMYAMSEGPKYGWLSPTILGGLVAGLVLIAVFIFVELRIRAPMLNLRLMTNGLFRNSNLVTVLTGAAFMGVLYVAPLFLQEGRQVDALTSGLTTCTEALGVIVGTQIASRIYPVIGPRRLMIGGIVSAAIVMALLVVMGQTTDLWIMRLLMFLLGYCMAHIFISTQTAAFANVTASETGHASALYNTVRQVGSALGVAVLSTVITAVGPTTVTASGTTVPNLNAYHAAFIGSAIIALFALFFAFRVSDKEAEATMRKKQPREQVEATLSTEASI